MAQDTFPSEPAKAKVAEVTQDAPIDGQEVSLSITKQLELRILTDMELRQAVDTLVSEVKEIKDMFKMFMGGLQ